MEKGKIKESVSKVLGHLEEMGALRSPKTGAILIAVIEDKDLAVGFIGTKANNIQAVAQAMGASEPLRDVLVQAVQIYEAAPFLFDEGQICDCPKCQADRHKENHNAGKRAPYSTGGGLGESCKDTPEEAKGKDVIFSDEAAKMDFSETTARGTKVHTSGEISAEVLKKHLENGLTSVKRSGAGLTLNFNQ